MRAVTDDSAYRVQFLVRGFRGVWLPTAPATVWAAGIAAAFVAVPAAFDAWGIVTQRVAPGAVGVVFAAVLAVVTAVPALMVAGAVVSRLHSPTTPFPVRSSPRARRFMRLLRVFLAGVVLPPRFGDEDRRLDHPAVLLLGQREVPEMGRDVLRLPDLRDHPVRGERCTRPTERHVPIRQRQREGRLGAALPGRDQQRPGLLVGVVAVRVEHGDVDLGPSDRAEGESDGVAPRRGRGRRSRRESQDREA